MDKLGALQTFVTVAEEGGFTAAATGLNLSKSQASRQIAALEASLGVQLLRRSTRVVKLTDAGYAYLDRARAIIADVREADLAVAALQSEPTGTLKINAPMSFGVSHVSPAVADFMVRYPALNVALILNDRFVDPYEEGFDVTLRIGDLVDSSLAVRKLARIETGIYASPAYCSVRGRPRHPEDLTGHDALHYGPPGPQPRWILRGPEGEQSISVKPRLCTNNGDALRSFAAAGLGIVLLPSFLVRSEINSGVLVQVLEGFEPKPLDFVAVYPPTRFVAAKLRLFIDFLAGRFRRQQL